MDVKNLKMNKKYRYTKTALVCGLLGTIAVGSGISLVHYVEYGMFKPIISSDDKSIAYEVDTKVYSKNGIEEVKSYDRALLHDKIAVFKYKDNNEDICAGWDISSLNKKQLEFIKSNITESDNEELKALLYYVSRLGDEITSEIDSSNYYNDNDYGMKYIDQIINKNKRKISPIYKTHREANIWNFADIFFMGLGGAFTALMGVCSTKERVFSDDHLYETTLSGKIKRKR